jgi:TonB family protein
MPSLRVVWLVLAALLSGVAVAVAAPSSAQAQVPPGVVLPVLEKNEGAEYPKQALDDGVRDRVTVDLALDIDATGHVTAARVKTPVGHGFDEAAVAAAGQLEFDPATRNGVPFAVTITFVYTFNPPAAAFSGRVREETSGRPAAGAEIVARGADGKEYRTTAGEGGNWRLAGLPPGKYHLVVTAPGFEPHEADYDLRPGQGIDLTDRLTKVHAPKPATSTSPATPPAPASTQDEVHVRGTRPPREVTVFTLDQREIERIPGTNGDALRSLINLPGVARPPAIAGILIVRGSAPQDTSVFIDGTLIPLVYHFGGLSSVVPTEMLSKIDFYPGNFSTEYGRALGGIVDVGMKDPKTDKIHALAQADFIDARFVAEGPIGNTGWNFAVGGRRSYVDLWLKPVLEQTGAQVSTAPVYYDYQALVERNVGSHGSFRLLFMGSDDRLDILTDNINGSSPGLAGGISDHMGFWRIQARYQDKWGENTKFRLVTAVGEDFTDVAIGDDYLHVDSYPISARAEVAQKLAPGVTANFGLDWMDTPYSVQVRFPAMNPPGSPQGAPFASRPAVTTSNSGSIYMPGIYEELELTPWKGGRLVPGLRLDYTKTTGAWDFAPRVVARQDLHSEFPRTTLKGGVGIFYQPPQPQETDPVFGTPGLRDERAIHYDVGVEQELAHNIDFSEELFYKQLDYLTEQKIGSVGDGFVYGAETLIRYKPDERFFGWLAYTLSRSMRRNIPGGPLQLSPFDQTHILTVLGSYRLGRGWEFGARFRLVSGNPYTPNTYGFYDENAGAYLPMQAFPQNGSRLPIFHQLDLRVDKGWVWKSGFKLGIYLDVQNVYNQANVEGISYNYNSVLSSYANGLPIIPSFGIRGQL